MMSEGDIGSIAETARALRSRAISPVELTLSHLERAKAANAHLNCLITIAEDQALAAARIAEAEIAEGAYRGPLHGIPFTAKDVFASAGIRTTAGSRILADWVPERNATAVQRLLDAGAILIAKNNLSEFASGPTSSNEHFGPTRNPWDLSRIPGGSSGGSAAAATAGVGFFSLGTDTGGSVRIPASLSGCVGLKPTFGGPRGGIVPLSSSLDTIGILARTTADVAQVYSVLSGQQPERGSTNPAKKSLSDIRIGLPRELLEQNCTAEITRNFETAIRLLQDNGATVQEVSIPWSLDTIPIVNLIIRAESAAFHRAWFMRDPGSYGQHLRDQILAGSAIGATDYAQAIDTRRAMIRKAQQGFGSLDVIAMPTVAMMPPPISSRYLASDLVALRQYARFANCTGQPALSVPSGFSSLGMPIGLQLVGKHGREDQLLRISETYEFLRGWTLPFPPALS